MKEIISAGGWLMLPIVVCSVLALAIGLERLFSLRTRRVLPPGLFDSTRAALQGGVLGSDRLAELAVSSPLGSVFAAGLQHARLGREVARDAMEQGGTLTVETSSNEVSARVEIIDSGCGIPEENLARIYDPFFTTKGAKKGTGLGLSITYGIVKEHGGSIGVLSQPGQGTRFHLEFPLVRKPVNA